VIKAFFKVTFFVPFLTTYRVVLISERQRKTKPVNYKLPKYNNSINIDEKPLGGDLRV